MCKCVVYLVTPKGLQRHLVMAEVGHFASVSSAFLETFNNPYNMDINLLTGRGVNSLHSGTLALRAERQSARMSQIKNDKSDLYV